MQTSAPARADRVRVTGLGVIAPIGDSPDDLWSALLAAKAEPVTGPAGPAYRHDGAPAAARPASRFAVDAAFAAVADAGLSPTALVRAGVFLGTGLGDLPGFERAYRAGGIAPAPSPFLAAPAVARAVGCGGPVHGIGTGCSAGVYAVGMALDAIRSGEVDVAIAGGTEAVSAVAAASLRRLGLLDEVVCRPFDADRAGMVPGEGAAVLVLESAAHAAARGHDAAYATVDGFGMSCDAHHVTAPEPTGDPIRAAVRAALRDAGRPRADVGAVVPHRAGVVANDRAETAALAQELSGGTPAYGVKAVLGHTGGAAGAFGCLVAALMAYHGTVPPNAHVATPDPDCPLAVPLTPTPLATGTVLVTGTGFGGNNAAVVISRADAPARAARSFGAAS